MRGSAEGLFGSGLFDFLLFRHRNFDARLFCTGLFIQPGYFISFQFCLQCFVFGSLRLIHVVLALYPRSGAGMSGKLFRIRLSALRCLQTGFGILLRFDFGQKLFLVRLDPSCCVYFGFLFGFQRGQ